MNDTTQTAGSGESPQPGPYFIDPARAETERRSLPVLIANRLCYMCRQGFEDAEIIVADPQDFIDLIVGHCASEQDFLLPDTPMKEAIFRVLLGNANDPMTAEQISGVLSSKWPMTRITSPEVIQRLLDNSAYYCMAPASESDVQYEESQRTKQHRSRRRSSKSKQGFQQTEPSKITIRVNDPGDPFDQSNNPPTKSASSELSIQFERLLYWLSAYGEGTRQTFAQACMTLKVADDNVSVRSAFRRMQLLGHIEVSKDGSKWSASPAALVQFADDSERGFLAGQRSPSLVERVSGATTSHQPNYQGPPLVQTTLEDRRDAVSGVADAGATAIRLVKLLPELGGWKNALQHIPKLNPAQFDVDMWDLATSLFRSCSVPPYERNGRYHGQSGMYRLSRQRSGQGEYKPTLFFDEPQQKWLRGDWYGLRFLALDAAEGDVQAVHVPGMNELLIPEAQRWPMLYERTLVLASGLLPGHADNHAWLKYQRIPFTLAQTLCQKLDVQLRQETIGA